MAAGGSVGPPDAVQAASTGAAHVIRGGRVRAESLKDDRLRRKQ